MLCPGSGRHPPRGVRVEVMTLPGLLVHELLREDTVGCRRQSPSASLWSSSITERRALNIPANEAVFRTTSRVADQQESPVLVVLASLL